MTNDDTISVEMKEHTYIDLFRYNMVSNTSHIDYTGVVED